LKPRVLLTCVGGTMMPHLITELRRDPVITPYLIGVDASKTAAGRSYVDDFHQVPWAENPAYLETLSNIIRCKRVDVVVPFSDQEAFLLSGQRQSLAAIGARVLTSPPAVLELIRNKAETYRKLRQAGIHTPEFECCSNPAGLRTAIRNFDYPRSSVVIKPVAGRGGRGMRLLIGNGQNPPSWIGGGARETRLPELPADDLIATWFSEGELMVMPMLDAPAYDVDVFAHKGRGRIAQVRQRSNPAGIPFTGNTIISDKNLTRYCLEIAEALQLDALHDIDLMTDIRGQACLLEVNPRPSGSIVAAHAARFPVMSFAIAETLGIDYPLAVPETDVVIGVAPCAFPFAKK